MAKEAASLTCWVVSDGKAGTENQCLGLAEALGLTPQIKRVLTRFPWRYLPPRLWFKPLLAQDPFGDTLLKPWPDLIIASGRPSVAPAAAIRRLSKGKTKVVQIQNPHYPLDAFDLVVVPEHDGVQGPNVLEICGAPHRVQEDKIKGGAEILAPRLEHLPRPYITVLIGGASKYYTFNEKVADTLGRHLAQLAEIYGGSLLITGSRRTGVKELEVLKARLKEVPHYVWDGEGENPYFALLGIGDFILVTCDSSSMLSEVAFTGKPIYIVPLPGSSKKFESLHKSLYERGIARPLEGILEKWTYDPLKETERVAAEVKKRFFPTLNTL